jgi:transposase
MTDYREVLRLRSLGLNHSQIAESTGNARQTVITVLQKALTAEIDWRTAESLTDRELAEALFPAMDGRVTFKLPDYEYVHREMSKPGMTQQLLWYEYCDQCRSAGDTPYGLTQFKKYYREFVTKTKATMHISRKPGEILEVDWAGQTARLTDSYTGVETEAYVFVAALEAACAKALSYTPQPNYKTVQTILKSAQDKISEDSCVQTELSEYGFTRGADYYGRGRG